MGEGRIIKKAMQIKLTKCFLGGEISSHSRRRQNSRLSKIVQKTLKEGLPKMHLALGDKTTFS